MKLNLGCGYDRRDGWLNVDAFAGCEPDKVMDLEEIPWDLPSDAFEHVLLKHVLEHVGRDFQLFAAIVRELYRVAAPGGLVEIHVPHLRHDNFWSDPTHVRAFTPVTFQMLSKRQNEAWIRQGATYTMLALILGVDFEVESIGTGYDSRWNTRLQAGEITLEELRELALERWNVAQELQVKLRVVK